jgi:hypothetical protein
VASSDQSVADAFRLTIELFDTGVRIMRENLRRRDPDASDDTIERRLQEWLRDRPGAEFGDCTGRPIDVPARPV